MIESTSSCTKASGSNPNSFTANGTIDARNSAPGISLCLERYAASRLAMPCAAGIPPRPAGCSITRLLSVIANWPSRKKPSRGVVAIQLGLPRPALRNAACEVRDVFFASLISSSLISNGLRVSNFFRVMRSLMAIASVGSLLRFYLFGAAQPATLGASSRQQHDDDHPPDREQRVADGVGDGVAERRHLAAAGIAHQAERCRGRARPGNDAEEERVVKAEDELADEHAEDQGDRRGHGAPQEQAHALRLEAVDEARPGRDADDGDEEVEADRVHEPDGRGRDTPEGRPCRAQPAEHDIGRASCRE